MIYIDFDGTMVNLWPRYFAVFCELSNAKDITIDEYKKFKRKYRKDEQVAGQLGCRLNDDYFERKKVLLEEMDYLKLDKLYLPANQINQFPKDKYLILTKRRNEENFISQLEHLKLDVPYKVVLPDETKKSWVETQNYNKNDIIIGDSTVDLKVSELGIQAYMVDSGLETTKDFDALNMPYSLYENVTDIDFKGLFK